MCRFPGRNRALHDVLTVGERANFDRSVALPAPDVMLATFDQVRRAYGETTARFVALQFEHPYGAISAW